MEDNMEKIIKRDIAEKIVKYIDTDNIIVAE